LQKYGWGYCLPHISAYFPAFPSICNPISMHIIHQTEILQLQSGGHDRLVQRTKKRSEEMGKSGCLVQEELPTEGSQWQYADGQVQSITISAGGDDVSAAIARWCQGDDARICSSIWGCFLNPHLLLINPPLPPMYPAVCLLTGSSTWLVTWCSFKSGTLLTGGFRELLLIINY
jgi:hypothetical protein